MNRSIEELKIRAKKLQHSAERQEPQALAFLKVHSRLEYDIKRKTCLNAVARKIGFADWSHTKLVLSGMAPSGHDMGKIWYQTNCSVYLNHWFADYKQAASYLADHPDLYLLSYQRQFVVVDQNVIKTLDLFDECDGFWRTIQNDLVAGYATDGWYQLVWQRISKIDMH